MAQSFGRPSNMAIATAAKYDPRQQWLYEQVGDGWGLLISFMRWFPDFLFDLLRAEDADYELTLIQRIVMRAKARYQYCDITGCRGMTKSFCSEGEECAEGVLWPGTRVSYYGPAFSQTAKIGSEIYQELQKNYPGLTAHWMILSSGKDQFEIATAYHSNLAIRAFRGGTVHKTVAEEYAQEEPPPFDISAFKRIVLPMVRAQYRINGEIDDTYIPFKQHFITSAGRRQNHSYETREQHFAMMQRGEKNAFVMDVPYEVVLLMGMRPIAWAENLRRSLTPDEWAREMESRYTGTDQNPVVRDETLTEARSLMLMEEHHCCRDKDNTLKPQDVIYVVGYDVSYADGAQNAKCACVVVKCTKQTNFIKRDKYLKQVVWIDDWPATDHMRQAQRLKQVWYRFCQEGSQTYIAIDAWQYGTAVLIDIMTDLQDGLAPLCVIDHKDFTEYELPGAAAVIYPVKAGGGYCTDSDSEMLRYAEVQFENRNVQLLTPNYQNAMSAYKTYHRIKNDLTDPAIYRPYLKTQELIGQIQNLKKVPSGAGMSERRISNKIQRDSWSALKYALRLCQRLEQKNLLIGERKSDWTAAFETMEKQGGGAQHSAQKNRLVVSRKGGRQF